MDGHQLIASLKSNPQTARIPIVVLATKMSTAENIREIQADYIIFKDIDLESQLKLVLKTALR
jgi:CheY-like chemotaxis protein